MNTKHTPGPWHIGMKPGPMIYGSDSSQVADLRADLLDRGERAANAQLIAAAPDLLALLQRMANGEIMTGTFNLAETVHEYQKLARAAIAKTIGEAK